MHPHQLVPKALVDLLLQFHRKDPEWVTWRHEPDAARPYPQDPENVQSGYSMHPKPWALNALFRLGMHANATDLTGLKALSRWIGEGPKTFRPTLAQCAALEQVEVDVPLEHYTQPYPTIFIEFPRVAISRPAGGGSGLGGPSSPYAPFLGCLCFLDERGGPDRMLVCNLISAGNTDDIVTVVAAHESRIENSLLRFDVECANVQGVAPQALRVAVNACLILSNYGCSFRWMFPKERASDEALAKERDTPRGERARDRLQMSPILLTFSQEVALYREETRCGSSPNPNGAARTPTEVTSHWRRGHWAMQPCGPGWSERKRIFRPPVLVRADRFAGDLSQTSTGYKGGAN